MKTCIFIIGPTAVGKSEVAEILARLGDSVQIISCDSMQVYKGLDILTCKPSKEILSSIPHHLINILDTSEEFDVARFSYLANKALEEIDSKQDMSLFVGGSGMYIDVLLDGIFEAPTRDRAKREALRKEAEEKGLDVLYERLKKVDPEAYNIISSGDERRIIRALEVYEVAGERISALKPKRKGLSSERELRIFGLYRDREVLDKRIRLRVESMLEAGVIEEVKDILRRPVSRTLSQAIGVNQIKKYLEGEISLDELKDELYTAHRQLVKKQLTWFRKDPRIEWILLNQDTSAEDAAYLIKEEVNI